jgi:hypothetical protein
MTELELIMALLEGCDDRKVHYLKDGTSFRHIRDTGKVRYFKEGSPDDRRARMALADMLWDEDEQIPAEVRHALAKLFEPRFGSGRKLKFGYRTEGGRKNSQFKRAVAEFIYRAAKRSAVTTVEDATADAAAVFKRGESRIQKIWQEYRPSLIRSYGALPERRGRPKKK